MRANALRGALAAGLGLLLLPLTFLASSTAVPRPRDPDEAVALARDAVDYRGVAAAGVAVDSSGNLDDATVLTRGGAHLMAGATGHEAAYYRFPAASCLREDVICPQVMLQPTRPVNPAAHGRAPFVFGAQVRLTQRPGRAGLQVIQRGGVVDGAARWSLSVDDGRVSCGWSDGRHEVTLPDDLGRSIPLRTGLWYSLRCARVGDSTFTLSVVDPDTAWPLASVTTTATMGAITPTGPVTIGALAVTGGSDVQTRQFHGDLDEIFFHTD